MSDASLGGKTVVVIGGASGVGFAVAEAALAAGAEVVVGSSRAANVEAAVARLGAGASGSAVDVTDEASVASFFERLGRFDHLAFTAGDWGASFFAPTRELDLAAAREGLDVRFWGALAVAKHACRSIAEDGCWIAECIRGHVCLRRVRTVERLTLPAYRRQPRWPPARPWSPRCPSASRLS